ncbi:carotenoid-cleaving dioxygenase, mitochondrial-like [Halichondria panicea]|uniref:carotenoid-cleaving dioxygenase, mitochondrial-like n=1 Tax=Halichondria panicea TaxID=6063 RepID=UPI00312B4CE3
MASVLLKQRSYNSLRTSLQVILRPWIRLSISTTSVRGELFKSVPEQTVPVEGKIQGSLPDWLSGKLIRNGPGLFEIGDTKLNHWFDGMALLHSFTIKSGKVFYASKFLRSDAYTKNMAANRLVVSEFGTGAVPDPCMTLFERVQSYFTSLTDPSTKITDNCLVNIWPAGDKYIASTESDFVHVFSPETLDAQQKIQLSKYVAVNSATAHPHIDVDGTVYNLGSSANGYTIIKIPPTGKDSHVMDKASVLCDVPPKNKLKPAYSHSFGATENYFVLLEQPFRINVLKVIKDALLNKPILADGIFEWQENELIRFFIVEKSSGNILPGKFFAPTGMVLHHINAYEDKGHVVVDVCGYDNGEVLYSNLTLEDMNSSRVEGDVTTIPRRYVLPIDQTLHDSSKENLVTLDYTEATAQLQEDGSILCQPESISEKSFEFPRIHYEKFNGRPYQFAYGLNETYEDLIKTDVKTKKCLTWSENGCSASEPVFVGKPESSGEDDGVILSAVLRVDESQPPFLLVLDARTMAEMARVEFPGIQWHKDVHGIFVPASALE